MSIWDDLASGWQDVNSFLAPAADFLQSSGINTALRDIIPGLGAVEDLTGIGATPGMYGTGSQWQPSPSAPRSSAGAGGVFSGGQAMLGGATGTFDLTTTGGAGRSLIPYSGGMIPQGYRYKFYATARSATPGRAAGAYLVKRRRTNPLNPHALLRAERRMAAFSHWVRRHFSIQQSMPRRKHHRSRKRK